MDLMDNLKCLPHWEEFYSSIKVFGKESVIDTTGNKANKQSNYHAKGGWETVWETKHTHSNDYETHMKNIYIVITILILNTIDFLPKWENKCKANQYKLFFQEKKRRVQGRETQWQESFPYLILWWPIPMVARLAHCEASRLHGPFIDKETSLEKGEIYLEWKRIRTRTS